MINNPFSLEFGAQPPKYVDRFADEIVIRGFLALTPR